MLLFIGPLGTTEIIVIVLIILLLFGGKKIPELMRGLGKGVKEFKDGKDGVDGDQVVVAAVGEHTRRRLHKLQPLPQHAPQRQQVAHRGGGQQRVVGGGEDHRHGHVVGRAVVHQDRLGDPVEEGACGRGAPERGGIRQN